MATRHYQIQIERRRSGDANSFIPGILFCTVSEPSAFLEDENNKFKGLAFSDEFHNILNSAIFLPRAIWQPNTRLIPVEAAQVERYIHECFENNDINTRDYNVVVRPFTLG